MNGVLIIDKPRGWTSHDVVRKARKVLRERHIGHAGTLDPLATGVLVLCAGKATRIVRYLESDDKEYEAEFRLGITTDTLDADGRPLEERSYGVFSPKEIDDVLTMFRGDIRQTPPAYSALKVNGVPSYRLARRGMELLHKERNVTIHEIELLAYTDPLVRIRVQCSKGTYIRTLCSDIGKRLGTGAHVTALTRHRSGRFRIEQALNVEHLSALASSTVKWPGFISLHSALEGMRALHLESEDAARASHGNALVCPAGETCPSDGTRVRLLGPGDRFIAVAVVRSGRLCPETVLV